MEFIIDYPTKIKSTCEEAVDLFDSVIKDNKLEDTVVLGEVEGRGCVILVGSYDACQRLSGKYTEWCIAQHPESWEQYCKGNVQLIIFDFEAWECNETMLGVTLTNDRGTGRLEYRCAFYGDDTPIEDEIDDSESPREFVNNALKACGGFDLSELGDFINKSYKKK